MSCTPERGLTTSTCGMRPRWATPAKSAIGSKGIRATSAGATTWALLWIRIVWPSGAAFATASAPTKPAAPPGRFSMTTGWPSAAPAPSASTRATRSVVPPGAKGTTPRTGRSGDQRETAVWARAAAGRAASVRKVRRRRGMVMVCPQHPRETTAGFGVACPTLPSGCPAVRRRGRAVCRSWPRSPVRLPRRPPWRSCPSTAWTASRRPRAGSRWRPRRAWPSWSTAPRRRSSPSRTGWSTAPTAGGCSCAASAATAPCGERGRRRAGLAATMVWNVPSKSWTGGATMADASLNRRCGSPTLWPSRRSASSASTAPSSWRRCDCSGARDRAGPALRHSHPAVGQREFAVETTLDLPSLAAGVAHLVDVTVTGARQGDRAEASLASSTRFIELAAFAWSNSMVRVLAQRLGRCLRIPAPQRCRWRRAAAASSATSVASPSIASASFGSSWSWHLLRRSAASPGFTRIHSATPGPAPPRGEGGEHSPLYPAT